MNHGLNLDGGIFVSYIGLFSYYNADNWTYQPSFVSSNTPWFFNGVRVQWFPTKNLKIEPWFINGWQSYARYNGKPGLGGQILWRPKPYLDFVWNNYGLGEDDAGYPGRSRIHADYSAQVKVYDKPTKLLDKIAFTVTGDLGCEYGGGPASFASTNGVLNQKGLSPLMGTTDTYNGGVNCHNSKNSRPKQMFAGWMAYNRYWFKKDKYALTLGGGEMNNPGRYLTLLPPIDGANAVSGTPYYTENAGDRAQMHDGNRSTPSSSQSPDAITLRTSPGSGCPLPSRNCRSCCPGTGPAGAPHPAAAWRPRASRPGIPARRRRCWRVRTSPNSNSQEASAAPESSMG